jgi:hypothetical protein
MKKVKMKKKGIIFWGEVKSHSILLTDKKGKNLKNQLLILTIETPYDCKKEWPYPENKVEIRFNG